MCSVDIQLPVLLTEVVNVNRMMQYIQVKIWKLQLIGCRVFTMVAVQDTIILCIIFMLQTRCTSIDDAEKLRQGADDFLDRALNTDVALIFAPSQIALAAILSSAAKIGVNLDR